jgi:hypothetical protein
VQAFEKPPDDFGTAEDRRRVGGTGDSAWRYWGRKGMRKGAKALLTLQPSFATRRSSISQHLR